MSQDDPMSETALRAEIARLSGELDTALAQLGGSGAGAEWKLRARVLRLEAEYLTANRPKPEPPQKPAWKRFLAGLLDLLERLSPIATPIVLALFGILLTGTTTQFLELRKVELSEQQLDLATIQALDDHLVALRQPNIGVEAAGKVASRIAYFGPRAIVPLVAELRTVATTADPRAKAIAGALEVSALYPGQRDRLCAVLGQAISDAMSGAFTEAGRDVAATVHAAVGCGT